MREKKRGRERGKGRAKGANNWRKSHNVNEFSSVLAKTSAELDTAASQ